jgi:hypothetical protein
MMLSAVFFLAAAMAGQTGPDPLAPARAGQLQCHSPNIEKKTCVAIAGYALQADGSYLNTANVLIEPKQVVAIEAVSVIWVKGAAVCGPVSRADILGSKVTIGGAPVPAEKAARILEIVAASFESEGMLGKEICTTYKPDHNQLSAEATVDGVARPDLNQPVIWVRPEDGYTLGL